MPTYCIPRVLITFAYVLHTPAQVHCSNIVCPAGLTGDGVLCDDVNECVVFPDTSCDPNAVCENTYGSYECTCNAGYSSAGSMCYEEQHALSSGAIVGISLALALVIALFLGMSGGRGVCVLVSGR